MESLITLFQTENAQTYRKPCEGIDVCFCELDPAEYFGKRFILFFILLLRYLFYSANE